MFSNIYFLVILAFLIFFLAIVVGVIVSVFLGNRSLRMFTTIIVTSLITLLILWTNVRFTGKVSWFTNPTDITATKSPTIDIGDS